jgi:hypothetical protein
MFQTIYLSLQIVEIFCRAKDKGICRTTHFTAIFAVQISGYVQQKNKD